MLSKCYLLTQLGSTLISVSDNSGYNWVDVVESRKQAHITEMWNSAGCQNTGTLLLLPSTFFRLFLRFLPCFPMAAVLTYFRLYLVATICHTSPECHAVTQLRVVTTPASQELRAAAAGQRSLPGPPEDITLRRDRLVIYLGIHRHRPAPCL